LQVDYNLFDSILPCTSQSSSVSLDIGTEEEESPKIPNGVHPKPPNGIIKKNGFLKAR
jgi:hypothetical protein